MEMIIKYKKLLIFFLLFVITLLIFRGLFSSSNKNTNNDSISRSNSDLSETISAKLKNQVYERDHEIENLKNEISLLKQTCSKSPRVNHNIPTIYVITPTYTRPVQKAELTRLSNVLRLVPNLYWVVIEDSAQKTDLVRYVLEKSTVSFTHLNAETPKNWKPAPKEPNWSKPRGVLQRNTALDWIRNNIIPGEYGGVIYFADDDNTYSVEIFEEMRNVKRVGVWPVGLVGGVLVERPRINSQGKVIGWLTVWSPHRPFAIDMAGFGINLELFLGRPNGKFAFKVEKGYQESELLKHFVDDLSELEPKADNCTKVYVWHTRTEAPVLREEILLKKQGKPPTNANIEV